MKVAVLQLSINDQLTITKPATEHTVANVCELLNVNLLKIVNCKLKLIATRGVL
jgi:hypothetical protein